jgi:hypothetical protein
MILQQLPRVSTEALFATTRVSAARLLFIFMELLDAVLTTKAYQEPVLSFFVLATGKGALRRYTMSPAFCASAPLLLQKHMEPC